MYCIQCGVKLADTENRCPLCATEVYHPQLTRPKAVPLYPTDRESPQKVHPWGLLLIVSMLFLIAIGVCLVCDIQILGGVTWSGYVIGALLLLYIMLVLPGWFPHPNPVIFVPIGFGAIGLYLLYINLATDGDWFLRFAFPVTAAAGVLVTAVVVLTRYIRKGRLYIYGGASIALGLFMLLLEFLLNTTFSIPGFGIWCFYPMIVLTLLGLTLLLIAICKPLRDSLKQIFFL